MKHKLLLPIIAAITSSSIIGCDDRNNIDIDYTITQDENHGKMKRSVEVLLPDRIEKSDLKDLAKEIHTDGFKKTFIGYRLEGVEVGAYWATTHYNPNLDISILGADKNNNMLTADLNFDGDIIGRWLASSGIEYKIVIYKRDEKMYIASIFKDGSKNNEELFTKTVDGQTRYYTKGGKGRKEYYIIGSDKRLQLWSENGNFHTASKY